MTKLSGSGSVMVFICRCPLAPSLPSPSPEETKKPRPSALSLWKEALSLAPDNDDYRIGYVKTLADARKDRLALSEARQLVKDNPSPAHLETLTYVWMRRGKKTGIGCWLTCAR